MKCFALDTPYTAFLKLSSFVVTCHRLATKSLFMMFNKEENDTEYWIIDQDKCDNETFLHDNSPDFYSAFYEERRGIDIPAMIDTRGLYNLQNFTIEADEDNWWLNYTTLLNNGTSIFKEIACPVNKFTPFPSNITTSDSDGASSDCYGIPLETIMLTVAGLGIVASGVGGFLYKKYTGRNLVDDVEERKELEAKFIKLIRELQAKKPEIKEALEGLLQNVEIYSKKDLIGGIDRMNKELYSEDASNNHIDTSGNQISGEPAQLTESRGVDVEEAEEMSCLGATGIVMC